MVLSTVGTKTRWYTSPLVCSSHMFLYYLYWENNDNHFNEYLLYN